MQALCSLLQWSLLQPCWPLLQWALLLPLVLPTYIIGYAYADLLAFAGPVQSALRSATGWRRNDYWFPELASASGVALLFSLVLYPYVYLSARATLQVQICRVDGRTGPPR